MSCLREVFNYYQDAAASLRCKMTLNIVDCYVSVHISNEHGSPAVHNIMRYHGLLRPYFSLTLPTRQYLKTNYTVPCSNLLFKYFTCQEANLESMSYEIMRR